jgi:hypothetical protein
LIRRCYSLAEWWHLLSLDAPTVAVLWSWFFARALHLRLPLPAIVPLGLVTWLLYVGDHLLDGASSQGDELLRERHIFCVRHRRRFLIAAVILGIFLAWTTFTRLRPQARADDLYLSIFLGFYLLLVHGRGRAFLGQKDLRWPKEMAVGILFAAATAVPAWSSLAAQRHLERIELVEVVILFAVLCWVNCVAIEKWESKETQPEGRGMGHKPHLTTRWLGRNLQLAVTAIATISLAAAFSASTSGITAVYLAGLLSCGLFLALDLSRLRLSPMSLRIAADAALLSPLALLPILR